MRIYRLLPPVYRDRTPALWGINMRNWLSFVRTYWKDMFFILLILVSGVMVMADPPTLVFL